MKKSIKVTNMGKEAVMVWYLNEQGVAVAINISKRVFGWEFLHNGYKQTFKLKSEAVQTAKRILNK